MSLASYRTAPPRVMVVDPYYIGREMQGVESPLRENMVPSQPSDGEFETADDEEVWHTFGESSRIVPPSGSGVCNCFLRPARQSRIAGRDSIETVPV